VKFQSEKTWDDFPGVTSHRGIQRVARDVTIPSHDSAPEEEKY